MRVFAIAEDQLRALLESHDELTEEVHDKSHWRSIESCAECQGTRSKFDRIRQILDPEINAALALGDRPASG
jgi:hypothetical protein